MLIFLDLLEGHTKGITQLGLTYAQIDTLHAYH
jgi:hypothetical protein